MTTPRQNSTSPRRAVGYVRVSTPEQAEKGVSLEAQRRTLEDEARARRWLLEVVADEGISAAADRRPALESAMTRLDAGEADVLMVTRLDRLTRSVAGLGGLLERAGRGGWDVVMLSPGIDTTDPAGRFTTSILACAAQYERDLVSQRTKEALAHRRATGATLGRPRAVGDDVVQRITWLRSQKMSLRTIAEQLNADNVPTAQGGRKWHASTVSAVLKTYAGEPPAHS